MCSDQGRDINQTETRDYVTVYWLIRTNDTRQHVVSAWYVGGRSSIGSSGFSFTLMTRCWTGLMVGKMLIYIASKAYLQL